MGIVSDEHGAATAGFANSQYTLGKMYHYGLGVSKDFGIPPETMHLVYHGIDTETFRPMPNIKRKTNRLMATASADVPQYPVDR